MNCQFWPPGSFPGSAASLGTNVMTPMCHQPILDLLGHSCGAEPWTRYLHTRDGAHEVDLISERSDQKIVACEVKLSPSPDGNTITDLS